MKNTNLRRSKDLKRPFLAASLLTLMVAAILLLLCLEPEMFIK